MKRKLTYEHSYDGERTKLCTISHGKKQEIPVKSIAHRPAFFFTHRKATNCFENLPNELIHEIFDYLDGCLLYDAFSNLNQRLQNLLTHPSFRLRISFNSYSEEVLERWCKEIILPNENRIVSFSFNNVFGESPILLRFPVNSGFHSLQSLTLIDIQLGELSFLLTGLIFLPRLSSLTISVASRRASVDLRYIYQLIFNLPALKYNKLSSDASDTILSRFEDLCHRLQTLEYLLIDHSCNVNDLLAILACTPRLTHLVCGKTLKANFSLDLGKALEVRYLTNITLQSCHLRFDQFEKLMKKVAPQLQVLRLRTYDDADYLKAELWENLINQHMPHLRIFQFRHEQTISRPGSAPLTHHQFTSAFWRERKWIFGISIRVNVHNALVVVYSIQPYRTNDIFDYDKCNNSPIDDQTNQLTIADLPEIQNDGSLFMDIIRHTLVLTSITRLNITTKNISINRLVELVRLLPNLDVLVLGSLVTEFQSKKCLSTNEVRALRDVSNSNKITKVILKTTIKLVQVQFLIDLCPFVQHFGVTCSSDISPESFLLFILIRNKEYTPNLSSICLRMAHSDKETLFKIQTIMQLENRSYTIRQTNNSIYLQWTVL